MVKKYLCYLLDSMKIIETDDPSGVDELYICTETEFDDVIGEFWETTIEDIMEDEFDPWEFYLEMFDESVRCNEYGCYTTDDTLNAMCSDIWEDIAYEMGLGIKDEDDEW